MKMKVTQEQVDKAEAAADKAHNDALEADAAYYKAQEKYLELKREREKMKVTKEQVDKAEAEWKTAHADAYAAWKTTDAFLDSADDAFAAYDGYLKLKQEFENQSNS